MRILLVHNYYQHPGGEDQVFAAESELLRRHGHEVTHYTVHNDRINDMGAVQLAGRTLWNLDSARALRRACREEAPDVVHFHNTFPLISPSAYYAVREGGAAVVQTLHNFRLLCPGTTLYREGRICEECLGRSVAWPGVRNACYRGSRSASLGVTTMVAAHRLVGTWDRVIDRYVAPTAFLRHKFLEAGFPAERVEVKPHFLPVDPQAGAHEGGYALYVGRLVEEKGIRTMLSAWSTLGETMPLIVAGAGPLASLLDSPPEGVRWLGQQSREQVTELMQHASVLIFPSEWYEAFGLTILEAFATALPVIASRLGAPEELVDDGRTGLHFTPGDPESLAAAVRWAAAHRDEVAAMGTRARAEYGARFTAEINYEHLMGVYQRAIRRRASLGGAHAPVAEVG